MKKVLLKFFLILLAHNATVAWGQFDKLGLNNQWYEGKVITNEGTELRGLIQYNDKLGLFKFREDKSSPDSDIKTFQEKSLRMLEYFDESINDYRKFYSLNCKVDELGFKGALLFEVVHEFKNKAFLRKRTKVALVAKVNDGLEGLSKNKGHVTAQKEGLFCLDENSELELFFVTTWSEYDGVLWDREKAKSRIDKSILKKYFAEYWDELSSYAKSNGLDFSNREDILNILEYCKKLEKD